MIASSAATQRYHPLSRWLHAAAVLLIALEYPLAWSMTDHRGAAEGTLASWHVGVGMVILSVMLLRLLWRLFKAPPPGPPMPAWQARAAHAAHLLLYAGFAVLPLLGWLAASARDWPVHWAGLVALPALLPPLPAWAEPLGDAHQALALGLLALVGVHVVAALYHAVVRRDASLRRMW
ncbi:cytochrome b/b6 domain-containing protein [Thiomonas sp.]|jgi:cytochrome b561|uniref:cytochrome b n=1 Tax=Thiomonas sp. TaxID=2047785 RepID=UPI00262EF9E9|nr:cytochrome b/b6 domain-containing protein [Thiomonas sp.]